MSSRPFAERILEFVGAKGYKPRQLAALARAMGVGEDEQGDFHAACKALMRTGRIVMGAGKAVMLPAPPGRVVGSFRANPRGFGFVVPDTPNAHGDLFVPAGKTGGAITGDTVAARVVKRGKRGGSMLYEGRIVGILRRGCSRFVGELRHELGRWFVFPDGNTLHVPIIISDHRAKGARSGDQVVVEVVQFPDDHNPAQGVIVKVLGEHGRPDVDTLSVIEQYQLPGEFNDTVQEKARQAVASYDPAEAAEDREDLSRHTIITIDPADAKDFDDAISVRQEDDGTTELGVHIADVAHFVRPGSALNEEARERANSVYLPNHVIPMLPEVLSNGVCSLQERQPRLTKSAFISYDRRGRVKRARFANTLIRSTKRLTYEQAGRILDGKPGRTAAKVVALVKEMETLARAIRKRRLREGMLVLDIPDVELVHDEDGAVIDAIPADTGFSHTIIEMFMVEANEAVARLLREARVPALRRIHDEPRGLAREQLSRFLGALGYKFPEKASRKDVQALLDRVRGKGEAFAVHLAVLRSMQQAEYSPMRIGHYALASKDYCHFTSPIRRYADLTIHRLLDAYLGGELKRSKEVLSEEALRELGEQCSNNERRAESAERELKLVLVLRLLESHVGEPFDGVVTGVANVGVFVQLDRFLVDGLLRFADLVDDWWEIDAGRGSVVGERSGHRITIGDRLKVVIAEVRVATRELDLALAKPLKKPKGRGRTKGRSGKKVAAGKKGAARRGRGSPRKQGTRKGKPKGKPTKRKRSR